ncbi:MAG: 30S ribosomal protein S3 [Candidatus Aenigmarchaeota archaeon]|nr:30S ribosomal protein S3 [Candidatus Aenigmarchaeota archaeon]
MKERLFIEKASQQMQVEEWLFSQFKDAKCGGIEINYTPLGERIVVYTASPGLVIGQSGERVREVTENLKKMFRMENPQIDVQKISKPDLNPTIVANSIVAALERKSNYKRVGKYYAERIMKAGAVGCEIVISGKLSGEKARTVRFIEGYLKKAGNPVVTDVAKGMAVATPPLGCIGVKVSIMLKHSDKKIEVKKKEVIIEKKEDVEEQKVDNEPKKSGEVSGDGEVYEENERA